MIITTGTTWETPSGAKREFSVAVDENDGREMIDGFAQMEWNDKVKSLTKLGDLLVLKYVFQEGGVTQDFFVARVAEIKAR